MSSIQPDTANDLQAIFARANERRYHLAADMRGSPACYQTGAHFHTSYTEFNVAVSRRVMYVLRAAPSPARRRVSHETKDSREHDEYRNPPVGSRTPVQAQSGDRPRL